MVSATGYVPSQTPLTVPTELRCCPGTYRPSPSSPLCVPITLGKFFFSLLISGPARLEIFFFTPNLDGQGTSPIRRHCFVPFPSATFNLKSCSVCVESTCVMNALSLLPASNFPGPYVGDLGFYPTNTIAPKGDGSNKHEARTTNHSTLHTSIGSSCLVPMRYETVLQNLWPNPSMLPLLCHVAT
jgi:hypothetical protein